MKDFKFFKKNGVGLTEFDKEFYDFEGFEFVGVSLTTVYSPETFDPLRYMLFKDLQNGEMIKGNVINDTHPMWDYNERF